MTSYIRGLVVRYRDGSRLSRELWEWDFNNKIDRQNLSKDNRIMIQLHAGGMPVSKGMRC